MSNVVNAVSGYAETCTDRSSFVSYLHSRGIDISVVREFGLGFLESGVEIVNYTGKDLDDYKAWIGEDGTRLCGKIVMPLYGLDALWYAIQLRSISRKYFDLFIPEEYKKFFSYLFFTSPDILRRVWDTKTIVVCESCFDAMSLYSAGCHCVVGRVGASVSKSFGLFLRVIADKIVIAFDNDAAGEQSFLTLHELLGDCVLRLTPSGKDFNDDWRADQESVRFKLKMIGVYDA